MNELIHYMQHTAIEKLVRLSQYTIFGSSKNSFYTLSSNDQSSPGLKDDLQEPYLEASRFEDFFNYFENIDVLKEIEGTTVLDFGCGYGGRAVTLAEIQRDSIIVGVDVHLIKISKARAYAERRKTSNATFKLCKQDKIPFPDNHFDHVLSYDVIEHVHYPEVTMKEINRVLKPGGHAFLVFPSYFGAVSHHLDFITMLPGLHWFFSADALMRSINRILQSDYGKRFNTPPQPMGRFSKYANKVVLPSLNGLCTRTFLEIVGDLELVSLSRTPLMAKSPKKIKLLTQFNMMLIRMFPWWSDHLSFNIVVNLRKGTV